MFMLRRALVGCGLGLVALIATACGPILTLAVTQQDLTIGDIVDLSAQVDPQLDQPVDSSTLRVLLEDRTLVTRSFADPSVVQFGFFGRNGDLVVNPRPGQVFSGTWQIRNNLMCYNLDVGTFCSRVHAATIAKNGRTSQILYFARETTSEPTVIFVDILPGMQIPAPRWGSAG